MENFKVNLTWLIQNLCKTDYINLFVKSFSSQEVEDIDLLNWCSKHKHYDFAKWLVQHLPFNNANLILTKLPDKVFYNGDVYIPHSILLLKTPFFILGDLTIKGKLIINQNLKFPNYRSREYFYAKNIIAEEILIENANVIVQNKIQADSSITINNSSCACEFAKAKQINTNKSRFAGEKLFVVDDKLKPIKMINNFKISLNRFI